MQRPENAVFRQIARGSGMPIGPGRSVKTRAAQLLSSAKSARGPSADGKQVAPRNTLNP